jgi:hypothetical protein
MKLQTILIAVLCLTSITACENDNNSSNTVDRLAGGGEDYGYDEATEEVAEGYMAEEAQSTYKDKPDGDVTWESHDVSYVTKVVGNAQGTFKNAIDANHKPATRTNDKIIKKGSVGLQVNDYAKDKHHFEDAIRKYDGYKSNENERTEISRISNTIEIRLPNQHFDKFIDEITTGEGIKNVDYKRTSAVDVGEEYMDLTTRIRTKKEVEKRYIDILRKSSKITDILAVEDQIRVIREEIESKEGRLRFLKDRISYSTVSLYIYENLEYDAPLIDKPTFLGKLAKAGNTGWNMILSFLLFLVYIWPIVLLLTVTVFLFKKKLFIFKNRK